MAPDGARSAGDMSVLSVRVTPATGARLTLYFRPSGYEQTSSRSRPSADAGLDPYAYP